jgi:P-loop containing NTP hydrolase pore-1
MTDLSEHTPTREAAAASDIKAIIDRGETVDRKALNAAMKRAFGQNDASGAWTQRQSFEVLELATTMHLRGQGRAVDPDYVRYASLLAGSLPTQTVRSEEQIEWQQFSTPADVGALAVYLGKPLATDIMLEPSAGNGLLAAHVPHCAAWQLNELDPDRAARLRVAFPEASVTEHDGALISTHLASTERPTLILMNPPFSRSLGRGHDDYAAARHLQAALRRLTPGGRIVAIMPDWFSNSARLREAFSETLRDCTVRTSIRLERGFAKHGTSIAVRLYVIDKVPGESSFVTIQRSTAIDVLDAVTPAPRHAPDTVADAPRPRSGGLSLLRSMRSTKAPPLRIQRNAKRNDVLPVEYETLATTAPLLEQTGVYLPYRPSRIVFTTAGEHPTALVESVAMGSIAAPIPNYVPCLPERTVAERMLSSSQLETVVYAGQAWGQTSRASFCRPRKVSG